MRLSYTNKNCDPIEAQNHLECQWAAMVNHSQVKQLTSSTMNNFQSFQAQEFYSLNEEIAAAMAAAGGGPSGAGSDSLDQYSAGQPQLVGQSEGVDYSF